MTMKSDQDVLNQHIDDSIGEVWFAKCPQAYMRAVFYFMCLHMHV